MADGCAGLVYIDPPFNTGRRQRARRLRTARDAARRSHRLRRAALPQRGARQAPRVRRSLRRLPRPSSSRASRGAPRAHADTARSFFHLDSREVHYCKVLLDGIFGRDALPERDHLGLRLRRALARPLARQARHHPVVRAATRRTTSSNYDDDRPHPVHGARPGRPREGGARQDADRRLVAHHRPTDGQREAPATPRRSRSASSSASCACTPPRRPRARLLRRQRHHRARPRPQLGRDFMLVDSTTRRRSR